MKIQKKRYIQFVLAVAAFVVIAFSLLINSPKVQQRVSVMVATELENRIGTRVDLGGIRWLFPNDIIIDSLTIDDQEGEQLLSVNRLAAKVEWMPLIFEQQLSIRNIRFFRPNIHLYKSDAEGEYNYQFLIDAFKTKQEKEKKPSRLSLRINTLLIRHAHICHHVGKGEGHDVRMFSTDNLVVDDFSTQLSLKTLSADSVSVIVRHLSLKEQSGLCVDDLYFRLVANSRGATLANFQLDMPHSSLRLDTVWASFPADDSLTSEVGSLIVKGRVLPASHITPADLAPLVPQVRGIDEKVYLAADFIGSPSQFNVKTMDIHTAHRDLVIRADAKWRGTPIDGRDTQRTSHGEKVLDVDLRKVSIKSAIWSLLADGAPEIYGLIPQQLIRIGDITATATLRHDAEQTAFDMQAATCAGNIVAHMGIDGKGRYTAQVDGEGIDVAQVIPTSPLTHTNLAMQAQGVLADGLLSGTALMDALTGTLAITATQTHLLGYEYERIALNGHYAPGHYGASLTLDDSCGALSLDAMYRVEGRMPRCTVEMRADSLDLHAMQLIDIHEDATFSTRLMVNLMGDDLEHVVGKVVVDTLCMHRPTGDYLVKGLSLYSSDPEQKMLSLKSDFVDATLRGELTYSTILDGLLDHLHHSLPSLCNRHSHDHRADDMLCLLNVNVYNTEPLRELFLMPIEVVGKAHLDAIVNDATGELKVTASVPHLEYDGSTLRGITFNCHSQKQGAELHVGATLMNDDVPALTASLSTRAADDVVDLGLQWSSNPYGMFEGMFHTSATFDTDEHGQLEATIEADSTQAILNHSVWKLLPFSVNIASERIVIDGLDFSNDNTQRLSADGVIARNSTDTLQVEFNDLDLGYVLSLVKIKGISFDGKVSGYADIANLYTDAPYVEAVVEAKDFAFSEGPMGDLRGDIHWDQVESQLKFAADVWENPQRNTAIDGVVDLKQKEMWINIAADSTNVAFLNTLLKSFMRDIEGNATGNIVIGGPLDELDLTGALMADVAFNLTPTDVDYHFKDSIRFTPGVIRFDGVEAYDYRNQKAIVAGAVTHDNLKTFSYDLYVDVQNVLGIDLPDTGHDNFYTTIYGTGGVHVRGTPTTPLTIDIQAQPEKGSLFALNLASQGESSSEAFITFTDRSSTRNVPTRATAPRNRRRRTNTGNSSSLDLDIMAHVTPDATLKLVMNQAVDDHISVSGSGDLQIGVHDDDITLFGTYTVSRGFYRLSLQDVINKDFDVIGGSYVAFEGDPMAARLDITARHVVNYVPLRDLSPDNTGNVHVNCLLRIGGTLNAPTIAFDLELPHGTEEEKAVLRSYTTTEEQMNLQFIYLLGLGKFYTPDVGQHNAGTNNMESLISSTISGQINNLLSGIISNDNWNFASNIRAENMMTGANDLGGDNWENMEIEGILEGRLLDNRLLINGNFGYRDNPMYATNFIGDFDISYLLTGGFSLKGYNKTNDRYFSKTSLTTQGVGLMYQRDFDRLFPRRKRKQPVVPTDSVSAE